MRKFEILIDEKPFIQQVGARQFRITFSVRYRYTEKLAFMDLAIYNLSREAQIEQGKNITLKAGYDEEYDQIFVGKVITVLKERDGANIVTRILCRSGDVNERPSIKAAVGRNTTIMQALDFVAQAWGVPVDAESSQFDDAQKFIRGYCMNGDLTAVMDALAKQFDFSWIETKDGIIVDRNGRKVTSTPREVSLFTGMIGVPEAEGDITGIFVRVSMRLSPRLRLRNVIDLKSEYASYSTGNYYIKPPENGGKLSGTYKVVEIVHRGDSWGDRWQTEIRGQKL